MMKIVKPVKPVSRLFHATSCNYFLLLFTVQEQSSDMVASAEQRNAVYYTPHVSKLQDLTRQEAVKAKKSGFKSN